MQWGIIASLVAATSVLAKALPGEPMDAAPAPSGTEVLEISAIVTKNGNSALECWQLSDAFVTSTGAGTIGAASMNIENLANATYTILPPRFEGGVHNAPHPQCVSAISFSCLLGNYDITSLTQ
jgi:hypothetical protein